MEKLQLTSAIKINLLELISSLTTPQYSPEHPIVAVAVVESQLMPLFEVEGALTRSFDGASDYRKESLESSKDIFKNGRQL